MSENVRNAMLADAVAAFNADNRGRARQLCEAGLKCFPADPALSHLLAAVLFAQNDLAEARTQILTSLGAQPNNVPVLILASRIFRAENNLQAAMMHLDKAASLDDRAELILEKARILDQVGDKAASRLAWQSVLKRTPKSAEALNRLGLLAKEAGALVEAEQLFARATVLENHPRLWFELGLVRHDLRDYEGAATAYRHVLDISPDAAEAAVNLGVVLQESGKLEEAMSAFAHAYSRDQSTFGMIAMALTSAPHGCLWLDEAELRRSLLARASAPSTKPFAINAGH